MSSSLDQKTSFTFPEVRVVEASAGSGKTYALAKRYTQLVLSSYQGSGQLPIKNILAITFTNKAAYEMKARILEFLKRLAFKQIKNPELAEIIKPIDIGKEEASRRAFVIMEDIIKHYNFFQVQTIDKFINALLSGCAFKLGLTSNFQIKTSAQDYLQLSLDELIDQAISDKASRKIFENFLHNYLYLENRSGWFPKEDMLNILLSLFSQNSYYGLEYEQSVYDNKNVLKKKGLIVKNIEKLRGLLPEETHKRFLNSIDKFLEKSEKGYDVDSIPNAFGKEEMPLNKGAQPSKELEKCFKTIKKHIREMCEEESLSLFDPYIVSFKAVMQNLNVLSQKDDCLFLSDLNKKALQLFDEGRITVDELYYRLATRFNHYLIDEFQDTSRLNWFNLEKMIEEALSTGGSLFYVGDRKQAIYRFRGGDVALFDEIKEEFNEFNVATQVLSKNWRSQKAIVDVNNRIFSIDNLKRFIGKNEELKSKRADKYIFHYTDADYTALENIFKDAQQEYKKENNGGLVQFEIVDESNKEESDSFIRERIIGIYTEVKKRFQPKDMAILTRTNKQVEQVTQWLLEEGLPVESERTSNILENKTVEELIDFLRFLNSPIDNLSFARFLLSDIFAKAANKPSEEFHNYLFELRNQRKTQKNFYLYRSFRKDYPDLWNNYIEEFFKNVGLYPLYELVVSIYNAFGLLDQFPDDQGFLMHFLELIKKREEEHVDLQGFLEYFDELSGEDQFVNVSEHNAVKVLTVHKAKGLEFPVVIIPYLGMDVQVGAVNDNKQSYVLRSQESSMHLLRMKKDYLPFSENINAIYDQEYKKAFISELNSIYVALTRAEHELYGLIPKKISRSYNPIVHLIPEGCFNAGQKQKYEIPSEQVQMTEQLPNGSQQDWLTFLNEEFGEKDVIVRKEALQKGEILHEMLSHVFDLNKNQTDDLVDTVINRVKQQYPAISDWNEYISQFKKIISSQRLKEFFYIESGEVFTEKDVITKAGHTKRIDRLIVGEDHIQIVDFKSSRENKEESIAQVAEYIKIIKGIYPQKKVSGYLIFMDTCEVDQVE